VRQLRGTNEIEVRVKLPLNERKDISHLETFVIRAPGGMEVPLMDIVEIRQGEGFSSINRRDGRRIVNVNMDVEPKRAMTRVREVIKRDELPQLRAEFHGLTWTFQGTQAEMRESTQALWAWFTLAIAAIYMLLAIAFGIVGAVIGHILLGYDLSLISLMGVIALSGVSQTSSAVC
jgi:multidrug efflux pump subunit AcrB